MCELRRFSNQWLTRSGLGKWEGVKPLDSILAKHVSLYWVSLKLAVQTMCITGFGSWPLWILAPGFAIILLILWITLWFLNRSDLENWNITIFNRVNHHFDHQWVIFCGRIKGLAWCWWHASSLGPGPQLEIFGRWDIHEAKQHGN